MLHPATLTFLRKLKAHNEKAWFDEHKNQYLAAKTDFEGLVSRLLFEMGKSDPDIRALEVKDCVFRIYKDVRFSKDKTPYKTHLAAGINKGGKKVHFPGFYFHVEPGGQTFCGGGIWRPSAPELKKIRQEIDYNLDEFLSIIRDPGFSALFGPLQDDNSLSRPPQGYSGDNPAIEYLRMRNYIAGAAFTDNSLVSQDAVKDILHAFNTLKPFIDFLGRALE